MDAVRRITVHHTGAEHHGVPDLVTVQRIEDWHRTLGWACIGYHYLIGGDGRVFEGRPLTLQGAHVRGCNRGNVGISLIGRFDELLPPPAQLAALEGLLETLRLRFGIDRQQVRGHRELSPTTCPGQPVVDWLGAYRAGTRGAVA